MRSHFVGFQTKTVTWKPTQLILIGLVKYLIPVDKALEAEQSLKFLPFVGMTCAQAPPQSQLLGKESNRNKEQEYNQLPKAGCTSILNCS